MTEKACTTCKEVLPLSEYSPDRRSKDGRQGRCRACCRAKKRAAYYKDHDASLEKRREYYAENREAVLKKNQDYRDRHPKRIKKMKADYYERVKDDPEFIAKRVEYREKTLKEKAEYDRQYRKANRKKVIESAKEWARNNPEKRRAIVFAYDSRRRAAKRGGPTGTQVRKWAQAQKKVCGWCGKSCASDYHIDHITPLSRGGKHELANLKISCPQCNLRKNARDPIEFARTEHGLLL